MNSCLKPTGPLLPLFQRASAKFDVVEVTEIVRAVTPNVEPDPAPLGVGRPGEERRDREVLPRALSQGPGEPRRVTDGRGRDLVGAVGQALAGERASRLVVRHGDGRDAFA